MSQYEAIPDAGSINQLINQPVQSVANITEPTSIPDRHINTAIAESTIVNQQNSLVSVLKRPNDTLQFRKGIHYYTYDNCYKINTMVFQGLLKPYLAANDPSQMDPVVTKNIFYLIDLSAEEEAA